MDVKRTRQGAAYGELGALEDLGSLSVHLGWQTLQMLNPQTAPPEREFMSARPPVRLDAVETFWEQKDYKVAAGWLARVSRSDPHYMEAQFYLGLSRFANGDFKGAEQSFQLVAAALPLNEVYNDLGVVQAQRQDYTAAAASFNKALEGDGADPDYHFNLGAALWRSAQYPAAAESFRAALARHAGDNEATVLLGRCLKKEGPRPGDKTEGKLRLKTNYEESAFRQLQAELGIRK